MSGLVKIILIGTDFDNSFILNFPISNQETEDCWDSAFFPRITFAMSLSRQTP